MDSDADSAHHISRRGYIKQNKISDILVAVLIITLTDLVQVFLFSPFQGETGEFCSQSFPGLFRPRFFQF